MKLIVFISSLLFFFSPLYVYACGAFENVVSNPLKFHFYQEEENPDLTEITRSRNLILWQQLTSPTIPLKDIETGVYTLSFEDLKDEFKKGKSTNKLIKWLKDNKEGELKDFLLLAKELEDIRSQRNSAWYYPSDKSGFDSTRNELQRLDSIISICQKRTTGKLADRYALQSIRANLTIKQYQKAIDCYNNVLGSLPEDNLFKQMAKGYIAGCFLRLGDTSMANRLFAEVGDYNSLAGDRIDTFIEMAHINPESPVFKTRLNRYIGYGDSIANVRYIKVADAALASPGVKHKGDWLFLKAYIASIYNSNPAKALKYINEARKESFSTPQMSDDARLFSICLNAENGNLANLESDVRWLHTVYGKNDPILFFIVPALLKKGRYTEALALVNYKPDYPRSYSRDYDPDDGEPFYHEYYLSDKYKGILPSSFKNWDSYSYASTGFQMLLSSTSDQVIAYKKSIQNPTSPLISFLLPNIRHDNEYLDEIIGTLLLREGDYSKAVEYLSRVSPDYQRKMNLFKTNHLTYDPFEYYYTPKDKWEHDWYKTDFVWEEDYGQELRPNVEKSKVKRLKTQLNAKLNFATEMTRLTDIMEHGKNADEKALARLRYAIGRYNSFNTCWALTQYWLGNSQQCNYQPVYWLPNGDSMILDYIQAPPSQLKGMDERFEQEIDDIFKQLESPEALAEANFTLRNYRTIARHYPDSKQGRFLAAHCDHWKDWL